MSVKTCQTSLCCLRFLQHQHARPENSGLLLLLQVYLGKERKPFPAPVSGGMKRNERHGLVWQLILLSGQSHGSRPSCLLTTCEKELSPPKRAVTGWGPGRPQPGPSILEEVAAFKKTKKIPHPYLASSSMGGLRKGAGTLHSWAPCYTQLLVKVSL